MKNENVNETNKNIDSVNVNSVLGDNTDNLANSSTTVDQTDLTANIPEENTNTVGDCTGPITENGNDATSEEGNSAPTGEGDSTLTEEGNSTLTEEGNSAPTGEGDSTTLEDGNVAVSEDGNSSENRDAEAPFRNTDDSVSDTPSEVLESFAQLIIQNLDEKKLVEFLRQFSKDNAAQSVPTNEPTENSIAPESAEVKANEVMMLKEELEKYKEFCQDAKKKYNSLLEYCEKSESQNDKREIENAELKKKNEELNKENTDLGGNNKLLNQKIHNLEEKLAAFSIEKYVEETKRERESLRKEMAGLNGTIAPISVEERQEAIREVNALQRETNEMLNKTNEMLNETKEMLTNYQVDLYSWLDHWRSSLFKRDFEGFANWYAKFGGYVGGFDKRLIDEFRRTRNNGGISAEEYALKFSKMRDKLQRECAEMENTMPYMGLVPFHPETGDVFDPEIHDLKEEVDEPEPWIVVSCERPGVKLIHSKETSAQVLVKAMVTVKSKPLF